ncbi:MAG TPA: M23 family metallopeptidase [Vicinamibacteria bacterium]|nr:M23 family metallopeptidase [Vicinamibacteria bacterium]
MNLAGVARVAPVLLVALLLVAPAASPARALKVSWHPPSARIGEIAWVHVNGAPDGVTLEGSVEGRPLYFFPYGAGQAALTGFDLDAKPGHHTWRVAVLAPGRDPVMVTGRLSVQGRDFPVERLTLPPPMVDLDPATERRALAEADLMRSVLRAVTPQRLWRGKFTLPVATDAPGKGFGARRVINDQPRSPHSGTDYALPQGTPVVAANDGRVALVGEHFFPGRLVVLDHGHGLYTLYFHLHEVTVAPGAGVTRGQPIGTVGASGRATGPHLHFGVQLGGARVEPASLLGLPLLD